MYGEFVFCAEGIYSFNFFLVHLRSVLTRVFTRERSIATRLVTSRLMANAAVERKLWNTKQDRW